MSRDQSGRSKWSREQAQNSNAIDRFFPGANSSVISVVFADATFQRRETTTGNTSAFAG